MKYGIILLSHSNMCKGLYDTAEMIFGTLENVKAVPFYNNVDLEDYKKEVMDALDELGHDSIVMIDLFGGTPFNTVLRIVKEYKLNALCGMNLPMVIQALEMRMQDFAPEESVAKIAEMAKEGIVDLTETVERLHKAA